MRLLERCEDGKIRLVNFDNDGDIPQYAILSHRWGRDEVLLQDIIRGTASTKDGYRKIEFCLDQASRDGLRFCWVDTCCIDKTNAVELQESINRMFRWYHHAERCYVYLADVPSTSFHRSDWFKRGWTLQELIAPHSVEFFSREGWRLGDKRSREGDIHDITGIPISALRGSSLSDFSVSERKSWMDERETTRPEDKAYSLLGIFNVCITLLYGEGSKMAFKRLLEKVDPQPS